MVNTNELDSYQNIESGKREKRKSLEEEGFFFRCLFDITNVLSDILCQWLTQC